MSKFFRFRYRDSDAKVLAAICEELGLDSSASFRVAIRWFARQYGIMPGQKTIAAVEKELIREDSARRKRV